MKRFLLLTSNGRKVRPLVAALLCTALHATHAHSDDLSSDEINLARTNNGAQIECTMPDGRVEFVTASQSSQSSAAALRDETLSCPLQEGVTTFVIKLPTTSLLERLTFVNENAAAAGELKISVSNYQLPAASPKWVDVDGNIIFSRKRLFNLSMVGLEARYVKLSFHVKSGGRLGALGLYGPAISNDVDRQFGLISKVKTSRPLKKTTRDLAALKANARVVYVSSGQNSSASRMIDENRQTAFPFAATDRRPLVIVELARTEELRRVTALYRTGRPGRLDVYLLNDMSKSATDLNYRTPDASATDENGDGEAAVDFDPQGAKYVAIRFTPTDSLGSDSFAAGSPGSDSFAGANPFEIIEIGAYGDTGFGTANPNEAPDLYASIYGDTPFAGEGGPEISSSTLGTLAIPPVLPAVSP